MVMVAPPPLFMVQKKQVGGIAVNLVIQIELLKSSLFFF